ncbi:MAG TPA: hypothetical protein VF269_08200 [Rhodanobacteraceae bacterium]
MSYVKPLAMAAALALSVAGMQACFAATHPVNIPTPQLTKPKAMSAVYYLVDAGTPQAHRVYSWKALDRNHDGQLERWEIPKSMWKLRLHFIYADFNGNGKLSPAEYIMWKDRTAPQFTGVFHIETFIYKYHH